MKSSILTSEIRGLIEATELLILTQLVKSQFHVHSVLPTFSGFQGVTKNNAIFGVGESGHGMAGN